MVKATLDLNVILEVFLERSDNNVCAKILRLCELKEMEGYLPSHGITTIFYLLRRGGVTINQSLSLIDDLNRILKIVPLDNALVRIARTLQLTDFEDAVVTASAIESHCDFIITRNTKDFVASPIRSLLPSEFIREFEMAKTKMQ
jgi:predicted nucleic acid-binding protein